MQRSDQKIRRVQGRYSVAMPKNLRNQHRLIFYQYKIIIVVQSKIGFSMLNHGWLKKSFFTFLFLLPVNLYASFIESTLGTAVVNDATATYHNPAALPLLQKRQVIALGSVASYHSTFTGQAQQVAVVSGWCIY